MHNNIKQIVKYFLLKEDIGNELPSEKITIWQLLKFLGNESLLYYNDKPKYKYLFSALDYFIDCTNTIVSYSLAQYVFKKELSPYSSLFEIYLNEILKKGYIKLENKEGNYIEKDGRVSEKQYGSIIIGNSKNKRDSKIIFDNTLKSSKFDPSNTNLFNKFYYTDIPIESKESFSYVCKNFIRRSEYSLKEKEKFLDNLRKQYFVNSIEPFIRKNYPDVYEEILKF